MREKMGALYFDLQELLINSYRNIYHNILENFQRKNASDNLNILDKLELFH